MDSTTKNPRVVAIHLSRVQAHLAEAFRELNRIDPAAFAPDMLKGVLQCTAVAWQDAITLASVPVIIPEKAPKTAKDEAPTV